MKRITLIAIAIAMTSLVIPSVSVAQTDVQVPNIEAEVRQGAGPIQHEITGRMVIVPPENMVADCTQTGCNDGYNLNAPENGFWFQGATADKDTFFLAGPKDALGAMVAGNESWKPIAAIGAGVGGLVLLGLLVIIAVLGIMAWRNRPPATTP